MVALDASARGIGKEPHDDDDSGGGVLELYSMTTTTTTNSSSSADTTTPLQLTCSIAVHHTRFASIAWTRYTGDNNNTTYPMGIIAGGMMDGTVHLYDPYRMMTKEGDHQNENDDDTAASSGGLITIIPPATSSSSAVVAMQFSPLSPFHLCTGTVTGRVTLIDCTDPTRPVGTEPGNNSSHPPTAEVTAVAWNTAVPHIVATAATDGVVTVWDIQSRVVWCEIRSESVGHAVSDIAWNPAEGLHLLTASGDDRNPVLRLWDLGTSTTVPLGTLIGHTAGIFRASYCPHDDSLLLTVAKDNRTFLWDLRTLQAVAELPMDLPPEPTNHHTTHNANALFASGRPGLQEQRQMRYDIQWSPYQRGVALTCSLDKKVQVHSLLSLATCTGRPPLWMTRKSSVSTGFGGLLVSCGINAPTTVLIQTIHEQPVFVETVTTFEAQLLQYQEGGNMIAFCQMMQQKSGSDEDKALWGFMQIMFETNARQEMLHHLGYVADDIVEAAKQYALTPAEELSNGISSMSVKDKVADVTMSTNVQELVKKSLVIGNFAAAVDCCFATGNYADALMLAACAGGDLWVNTQQRYFDSEIPKRPFLAVVSSIVRNQLEDVVNQSDLASWHETLAILSTYSQSEEFPTLCIMLGDRLNQSGDDSSASLCYMCALNLERSVQFWMKQMDKKMNQSVSQTADLLALHEFVEKVTVFLSAVGPSVALTPDIEALYFKYSTALADQGLLVTATKYCCGMSESNKILRDRLYRSRASHQCFAALGGVAPEFPYVMVDVQQSRGQVYVQPAVAVQNEPAIVPNEQSYPENQQSVSAVQQDYGVQPQQSYGSNSALAPGWVALQDPTSGNTYYANEMTGETTCDMPKAPVLAPYSAPQMPIQQEATTDVSQRAQVTSQATKQKPSIVSKYGDGFVSSASNPELASQYGNIGTSNPYGGTARPGPAAVQPLSKAPVSGNLNIDTLQLSSHHASIRDTLLGAANALKQTNLNVVEKKQLEEAEKSVAILVKKLARDDLNDTIVDQVFALVNAISQHDFAASMAYQTTLANSEWRDHKDWLKGIKILIQLAIKKF